MTKIILFVLISFLFLLNLACSNATTSNSATNQAIVVNSNPANLPDGLSTNQITLSNDSTPGIPDPKLVIANSNSKGASSTPGIPDTAKSGNNSAPTKTPPIPGIPDEETLRKQMNTPADRSIMDRKPPEVDSNSKNHPDDKRKSAGNSKSN